MASTSSNPSLPETSDRTSNPDPITPPDGGTALPQLAVEFTAPPPGAGTSPVSGARKPRPSRARSSVVRNTDYVVTRPPTGYVDDDADPDGAPGGGGSGGGTVDKRIQRYDTGNPKWRRQLMEATGSKQPANMVAQVEAAVIDAVLLVPNDKPASDKQMYGRLIEFAVHTLQAKGSFEIGTDLTHEAIKDYVDVRYSKRNGTPGTVASALERVRKQGITRKAKAVGEKRPPVGPYTRDEWELLWAAARGAGTYSDDACVLLTLTGELGLHAEEANYAHASWVIEIGGRPVLRVPDANGEFRDLPLSAAHARILNRVKSARPDTFLLTPTVSADWRKNVCSRLPDKISPSYRIFDEFYAARARSYWLSNLLTKPLPFNVVTYLARNGTSITPVKLAAALPQPTAEEVRASMRAARLL